MRENINPYQLQMDALLKMNEAQQQAEQQKAEANTQAQMLAHAGNFLKVATAPRITQSEIMAKVTPQASPLGEQALAGANALQAQANNQYNDTLNRYKMQNDMMSTLAKMKSVEQADKLRNLQIQDLESQMSERNKPYDQTKDFLTKKALKELDNKTSMNMKLAELSSQGKNLTPGQKSMDQDFAKQWSDFKSSGGFKSAVQDINTLSSIDRELAQNNNIFGPLTGVQGSTVRKLTNPKSVQIQQDVERIIQGSLKQTLGAQFTEKEGENLLKRTIDPSLPDSVTRERVALLKDKLAAAAKSKYEAGVYFDKHGTLAGFQGSVYTNKDFSPEALYGEPSKGGSSMDAVAGEAPMFDPNKSFKEL